MSRPLKNTYMLVVYLFVRPVDGWVDRSVGRSVGGPRSISGSPAHISPPKPNPLLFRLFLFSRLVQGRKIELARAQIITKERIFFPVDASVRAYLVFAVGDLALTGARGCFFGNSSAQVLSAAWKSECRVNSHREGVLIPRKSTAWL